MTTLTENAASLINQGSTPTKPVMQVHNVKKVESQQPGKTDRYRLLLSDGVHCHHAMLATRQNELVEQGVLQESSIVCLDDYLCNTINDKKIIIVLAIQVLVSSAPRVGNPVIISAGGQTAGGVKPEIGSNAMSVPQPVPSNPYSAQQPPQQSNNPAASNPYQAGNTGSMSRPTNQGPVAHNANGQHVWPIKALNPYQSKWAIKARVTVKDTVRTWNKGPTNQGKLFSVELMDSEGSEIRATFFKEAVDNFLDVIQQNKVYIFTGGVVKVANRKFSNVDNNYEINFGRHAEVTPVEDDVSIKTIGISPTAISDIANKAKDDFVDILGVAVEVGDVQDLLSRAGKPLKKLDVTVVDPSNASIKITFWNDKAEDLKQVLAVPNQVVGIKRTKISEYGGRSLSTMSSTQVLVNPDIPEAAQVRQWFDNGGSNANMTQLSSAGGGIGAPKAYTERHTLSSITDLRLGTGEKDDFIEVKATILYVKRENLWYPACPDGSSQKKVVVQPDGSWFCEHNNQHYDTCLYRYIASLKISDHSGVQWVTVFNDTAEKLFGISANNLQELQTNNEAAFDETLEKVTFKTAIFKLRVKHEVTDQSERTRLTVLSFREIDYPAECADMLQALRLAP